MEPAINEGESVLVSSIPYFFSKPKTGNIVAFKKENKVFIKRIKKIRNDKYYLIGDNEKDSLDSEKFGLIPKNKIIGKVILVR